MKLLLILVVCGLAAAAPNAEKPNGIDLTSFVNGRASSDSDIINALLRELMESIRRILFSGSLDFGVPILDPRVVDYDQLHLQTDIANIHLDLKNNVMTGIGGFIINRIFLDLDDLSVDYDFTYPTIQISAEHYDLSGELFSFVPLYGNGKATFTLKDFRYRGKVFLVQSEDEKSAIIGSIEGAAFNIPYFRSELTGVIGGGPIDDVINRMIEEVLVDYANRFHGYIASEFNRITPRLLNPFLEKFESWRYIEAVTNLQPKNET